MKVQFRASFPKEMKGKEMRNKLRNALHLVQRNMVRQFEEATATWENPPDWDKEHGKIREREQVAYIEVSTDDKKFLWVNDGVEPHPIPPRGDHMLFFHSDYDRKSVPGEIRSYSGGPGPKNRLIEFIPDHPGIKPRYFDQQIAQNMMPLFLYEMNIAMREAAQASGWAK